MTTFADAAAAHIREQSERTIREHAAATRTATRTAVSDFGRYPTLEQRRDALLRIAEYVAAERGQVCQPISQVVPLIVPTLAAAAVSNVLAGFDVLVEAVWERLRFVADADGWRVAHGVAELSWESMDDSTLAAVDLAVDELMGVRA